MLGILWNKNDEFLFDFTKIVEEALKLPLTKRSILCIGAKFFHPVGFISPIVIVAKIFFQKICLDELQWDDVLSVDLANGWKKYLKELAEIGSIDRYLFKDEKVTNINLHGFCDSSNQAYCAVIYAQAKTSVGVISRILT